MKGFLFNLFFSFFVALISISVFSKESKEKHLDSCPTYKFNKVQASFSHLSPAKDLLENMNLPRSGRWLYRGINDKSPQFSLNKTLRAMFGDQTVYIGTWDFDRISAILTGALDWNLGKTQGFENSEVYKSMLKKIQWALKCKNNIQPGSFYELHDSQILAADIMDTYFSQLSNQDLSDLYVNFTKPQYKDHSKAILFSSVYQNIALGYGRRTVVMNDSLNRTIDLNYANFKMHGQWRHHVADTGEFIFPGYVLPNEIVGYIIRENPESDWKTPIDLAFFKLEFKGKTYVVVYDGDKKRCIEKSDTDEFFFCKTNFDDNNGDRNRPMVPRFPTVDLSAPVPVMGILSLCQKSQQCEPPDDIWQLFQKNSVKKLPIWWDGHISKIAFENQTVKYWPVPHE